MSEFDELPLETKKCILEHETAVLNSTKLRLHKALGEKNIPIRLNLLAEIAGLSQSMSMCFTFLPIEVRKAVMEDMHRIILRTAKQRSGALGFLQEIDIEVSGEMN